MRSNPSVKIAMSEQELDDFASIIFKGHKVRRPRSSVAVAVKKPARKKRKKKAARKKEEESLTVVKYGLPILATLAFIKLWSLKK